MKVYFLGLENTENHLAAQGYNNTAEHVSVNDIDDLISIIENEDSVGLLPIETKLGGIDKYVIDYLNLYKTKLNKENEFTLTTVYSLVSLSDDLSYCDKIYIPKHVRPQISDFLGNVNLMQHIDVEDIIDSADKAKNEKQAAAVTLLQVAENYGLNVLDVSITNTDENWIKYAVIKKI